MEFVAYHEKFKVAYGTTVDEAIDIVSNATGSGGRFRLKKEGID